MSHVVNTVDLTQEVLNVRSYNPCEQSQILRVPSESIHTKAQNTRGRWAIRPRELHNRLRQSAHGGDCKIKIARWNYKINVIFVVITLKQYWVSTFKPMKWNYGSYILIACKISPSNLSVSRGCHIVNDINAFSPQDFASPHLYGYYGYKQRKLAVHCGRQQWLY